MERDNKIIKTPIIEILKECNNGIPRDFGVIMTPMRQYIMQSLFLKMTGALEQKLKCIIWELSLEDYNLRYEIMRKWEFGECSSYKDKNNVIKKIFECIDHNKKGSIRLSQTDKISILNNVISECKIVFDVSEIVFWYPRQFNEYKNLIQIIVGSKDESKLIDKDLFQKDKILYKAYDVLYRFRNRCAHNLLVYQNYKKSFSSMIEKDSEYQNWFLWFFILILIDYIFIESYMLYEKTLNE